MQNPATHDAATRALQLFRDFGRIAIIVGVLGIAAASRMVSGWNGYQRALLAYGFFLLLAPGFGAQYLVLVVPLLLAVSVTWGWVYGSLSGFYVAVLYAATLVQTWPNPPVIDGRPLLSVFTEHGIVPGAPAGLVAWSVLLVVVVWVMFRRASVRQGGASA
jgi:hypothetical protein